MKALDSLAFIACAIPFFMLLETVVPREPQPIRWRAIVFACAMLAFNTVVVRQVISSPSVTADSTSRVLGAWLVAEVFAYWLHRGMHRIPLLWRFHKLHHAPQPLAWHQSWWIHPLDMALFAASAALAVWLVGAPLTAAPWLLAIRKAYGILLHANVRWPKSWLDHVIVTPLVHHRHHREDQRPANFAGQLAILDRVFATWTR
jgi:sterol desaturase/sphingolipid hydroxylase (fatty acid hydroxylase superfamily)